jgi:class 3 adenylate cyclase
VTPYPWQRDTRVIPPVDFNETIFNSQRLDYSVLMDAISLSMLNDLTASADLQVKVRDEALKLFLSLIASLLGITFVSRAQRKSSAKVELALSRTREMSRAVGAFVPRSFLKLMGVDSILHLQRGDQTEVSVALVFSDIRNFTGISEHMTNEQLFEWLQAHLTRMTTTTERHHGFVDKFIEDAVSSVFLDCSKAVQCAIRMQAVTDALCYELIAGNQDHLVKIGVGIHYATVGVGVLGNAKHHSCSIVSSEIAVPAQLEALTKEYGARILITEQVAERLKEDEFENRLLGRVRLSKSSTKEYQVYEIYNADSIEMKTYKKETAGVWEQLLRAQNEENFPLVQQLSQELAQVAQTYSLMDPAALLKSKSVLPFDQFDM